MHTSIFTEISLVIVFATAVALVMRMLRQPLIIGYILTGIVIGPSMFGFIETTETIELLGSFGISLLLFLVGLGLNPRVIKEVGRVAITTGLSQIIFTTSAAFALTNIYGFDRTTALFVSIAMAFSSTIIIVKLLTDKKEQNKLYGKVAIGFLLVQDIVATLVLLIASANVSSDTGLNELWLVLIKAVALGSTLFVFSHLIIRPMTKFLTRTQELLFLFALAWGFGISSLFYEFGLSLEIGALFAGVALSTMSYAQEVSSRLRPLRDFFIVVFFISLGARLSLDNIGDIAPYAIGLAALVLLINPLITTSIMGIMGYTKKTSFKAGLATAQISEFSIILILVGLNTGQIPESAVSLVTLVAIITITVSSYMIIYSDSLFTFLEKYLQLFERKKARSVRESRHTYDAILFGYKKGGQEFVRVFGEVTSRFVVIDYDPEAIDEMERKEIPYLYGDATDIELLEEVDLSKTRLIVSHITDHPSNVFLVEYVTRQNSNAVVICHAETAHEAAELYGLGASYVMMPHYIGSERISSFIKRNGFKKVEYRKYKERHIAQLQSAFDAEEAATGPA